MNYTIIKDEKLLKDFIEWLPELSSDEVYVVNLFARNKYSKDILHINSDKAQMKRFVATKDWMLRKIKQLETEIGTYYQNDIQIPQEALALYITLNPRSQVKAAQNLTRILLDKVLKPYNNYNVAAEALSELQKAWSRKIFVDFDIDFDETTRDIDYKKEIEKRINKEAVDILVTKNGIHVLVKLSEIDPRYKNTWYNDLAQLPGSDVRGEKQGGLIPVPGCVQGNFTPHFYENNN